MKWLRKWFRTRPAVPPLSKDEVRNYIARLEAQEREASNQRAREAGKGTIQATAPPEPRGRTDRPPPPPGGGSPSKPERWTGTGYSDDL